MSGFLSVILFVAIALMLWDTIQSKKVLERIQEKNYENHNSALNYNIKYGIRNFSSVLPENKIKSKSESLILNSSNCVEKIAFILNSGILPLCLIINSADEYNEKEGLKHYKKFLSSEFFSIETNQRKKTGVKYHG